MKAFKSLFAEVVYTKIEYVKNHPLDLKYHTYQKVGNFSSWEKIDERKTLDDAEEIAKSRGEKVFYMGIYENGRKIPNVSNAETGQQRRAPAPLPYVLPPNEEVEIYARRTRRLSKKEIDYEFKPYKNL